MKANAFAIRPVNIDDAEFVARLRSSPALNQFIHSSSTRTEDQVVWIERYFERQGDWYFIVEDGISGEREGTIAIYDYDSPRRTAEWGRWILRPGSLAAIDSALLIYRAAFEALQLQSLFCRTVADNRAVTSFHDSSGAERRALLTEHFELGGRRLDAVEHFVDQRRWDEMRPKLEGLSSRLYQLARRGKHA